jgi:hypothetical protein
MSQNNKEHRIHNRENSNNRENSITRMPDVRNLVLYCSRCGVCNQVLKTLSCLLVPLDMSIALKIWRAGLHLTLKWQMNLLWSKIIRLLVYEPYRNFINTNTAGCFDSKHLSHKNAIESEGDSPGLLTHVVCRVSAGYLLCAFYLLSTFHGTKCFVACVSRYGQRICGNV